jgi:WD40 repeat protein
MSAGRQERLRALFDAALELPGPAREDLLQAQVGDDNVVAEVRRLLASADDPSGSVIDGRQLVTVLAALCTVGQHGVESGARIGNYTLVRVIDEGGMGVVFEARQETPRRSVALKVMRDALATAGSQARFEREAEILGRLQHPGIAQVYESGLHRPTAGGAAGLARRPVLFFAMEYVAEARSILAFSAAERLSVRARLELMARVCDAVQYAHQKGVIHRDLKPANILVDAGGNPKVIDFGVARATEDGRAVAQTVSGQMVGTLRYMSPEQCGGDPAEVDTRSDVYSLGVVLYELLTGQMPHDLSDPAAGGLPSVVRTIRESPARRGPLSAPGLRGDVGTIVLKALEKDRSQRYQSAGDLAEDLRRSLRHEPIRAHPPSSLYQVRAFARRNRMLVGGSAATLAALVFGLMLAMGQLQRARNAERRARAREADMADLLYRTSLGGADAALRIDDGVVAREMLERTPHDLRGWEWRHLAARSRSEEGRLEAPASDGRLTAAPDGGVLLGSFADGTLRCWDGATLAVRWTRKEYFGGPPVFCGDGRAFSIVGERRLGVFATDSGAPLHTLEFKEGPPAPLGHALNRDGTRLAVAFKEPAMVRMYDLGGAPAGAGAEVAVLWERACRDPAVCASAAALTAGDTRLVTAEFPALVLRNTTSGDEVRRVALPDTEFSGCMPMTVSPDGRLLATAAGRDVLLYDAATLDPVSTLRGHTQWVTSVAFDPATRRVAAAAYDSTVRVWEIASGAPGPVLLGPDWSLDTVAFARGGGALVSVSHDGEGLVWNSAPPPAVGMYQFDPSQIGPVTAIDCAPDGSGSGPGRLMAACGLLVADWDLGTGRVRVEASPTGAEGWRNTNRRWPALDARHGLMLAEAADDRKEGRPRLGLWRVPSAEAVWIARSDRRVDQQVVHCALSHDARYAASISGDAVRVLNAATGAVAAERATGQRLLVGVEFSAADPSWLVTYGEDQTARTWSVPELAPMATLAHHGGGINAVAIAADGSRLATCCGDGIVRVWEPRGGREVLAIKAGGPYPQAAFSPDGSRLAVGGTDRIIRILDAQDGWELLQLRRHTGAITCLAWSPDGRYLASGGSDHRVFLWDSRAEAGTEDAEPASHA